MTPNLLSSLSDSKVVHLQWIPGHFSLPDNDLVDSLAKVGAIPDPSTTPLTSYLYETLSLSLYQLEMWYSIWFLLTPNPFSIF